MLALIAGRGDLPVALTARLTVPYITCALQGFAPDVPVDIVFRLEHLGSFLQRLKDKGVSKVCMAGAIRRPPIDPTRIDAATAPLVPQIQKALTSGDDGALRAVMGIFESAGINILAAHQVAPDLIPQAGVLTTTQPGAGHAGDAMAGDAALAAMGAADSGQACILQGGTVLLREDANGTDHMIRKFAAMPDAPPDAVLFKGPKPQQDLRADMPVIGLETAQHVCEAGLAGIVIAAGGVMVLDLPQVIDRLDGQGRFLWVRPKGAA